MTEPFLRYVNLRLEAWAAWRKMLNLVPGEVQPSILGRMIDEGIAALSHGQGFKPEPEYTEEEEVEAALRAMPTHLSCVIIANYTSWHVHEVKLKALNRGKMKSQRLNIRQYRDFLNIGRYWLHSWLEARRKPEINP